MAVLTIPNLPYINNTQIADGSQVTASFNAIQTWSTSIDRTNTTTGAGFDFSYIKPSTNAAATWGGSVGAIFTAPAVGQTPVTINGIGNQTVASCVITMGTSQSGQGLLVSGAASITGNPFEIDATSGGTQWLYVSKDGILTFPTGLGNKFPNLASIGCYGASNDSLGFTAKSSSTTPFSWFAGAAEATTYMTLTAPGGIPNLNIGTSNAGAGEGVLSLSAASGFTSLKSSGSAVQTVTGSSLTILANGTPIIAADTSGDFGILGTLHQASARKYKTRIEYVDPKEALDVALKTRIARYDWKCQEPLENGQRRMASFIADDTPWQLSGGPGREHADPQKTASYALAALQAVYAELQELKGKLPTS